APPVFRFVRQRIVELFATGLYLGKIKFAPGTFGTILGIPFAWALATYLPPYGYLVGIAVFFVISAVSAQLHERYTRTHDPGEIVIDEVVGYIVAMTWLPLTWQAFVAAFFLFRFFDIAKPPPIRQIDRGIGGGVGTTLDDMAAGLVTNLILQWVASRTDWLGVVHGT
ncbi:MAG: phosphatidylglycerophosphatase A, partial [Bdellovibrionota bacterium]